MIPDNAKSLGKIRRVELRQLEAARRQDGSRAAAEFWEEDFPELAGRRDPAA